MTTITVTIDATPEQLAAIAAALGGSAPAATTQTSKPADKPKETPKAADKPKEEAKSEPAADVPSRDAVTAAAQALVKANGREALADLLGEFEAKNLSGLKDEQLADFIAKAEKGAK